MSTVRRLSHEYAIRADSSEKNRSIPLMATASVCFNSGKSPHPENPRGGCNGSSCPECAIINPNAVFMAARLTGLKVNTKALEVLGELQG